MSSTKWITLSLFGLVSACGGGGGGGGGSGGGTGSSDPCGNALGNGNTVISGPAAADGVNNLDSPFRSLTVHPTDPNTVYVGTEENGILRSTDAGVTWERLRNGIRHSGTAYPEIYDLAISATNPDILFAATSAGPGLATGSDGSAIGGVYKSEDGGDTWERKNCNLPTTAIGSVYISPNSASEALVGLAAGNSTTSGSSTFHEGGVYRTTDGGDNWAQVPLGALEDENTFYQLYRSSGDNVYTFGLGYDDLANNLGFANSVDAGSTWATFSTPFTNNLIAYITVSADDQRIILMEQDLFMLHTSEDSGSTWSTSSSMISPNGPVRISPTDKDIIVVAANEDLWFSDDGLATASMVVTNAVDFFQDIEFAPSNTQVVYAVTRGYDFFRSDDGGQTFPYMINLRTDVINVIP